MIHGNELARPVVRATTSFHGDLGSGALLEEGQHLCTTQIDAQHRPIRLIDGVQREHRLGRVNANALNLGHGRLLSWLMTAQVWHPMPWGRPPQQSDNNARNFSLLSDCDPRIW